MLENLEEVKKAKSQIVQGALIIWNERLTMLSRSGDLKATLDAMTTPVEYADNCGCGNNCVCGGAESLLDMVSRPAKETITKTG